MTISMQKSDMENITRFSNLNNEEAVDSHICPNHISIDNNNNETPKHNINSVFERGKKYDSGLEILSPQSDKSVTNIFANSPEDYLDNNGNRFLPMRLDYETNETVQNKWATLNIKNAKPGVKNDDATHSIIEIKSTDQDKNSKTKIVIYRNEKGKFRHLTIQDFRIPEWQTGVRRSNTFSHDCNNKEYIENPMNAFHSIENLPLAHTHNCSQSSLANYPSYNSCSELYQLPQKFESVSENLSHSGPKSTLKQRILSRICSCLRPMCNLLGKNTSCDEDDDNNTTYTTGCVVVENLPSKNADWQYSFVEFNDLTYLSSGAEGSVYTAILNGVKVALKKVSKEKDVQIENLLKLKHENIVKFIGVCIDNPFYIVMEYCSGGQLYQWLRLDIDISVTDIVLWTKQLCEGMAYLHLNDIIHRDLKSPNALISENKILKIIDFGFGKSCPENAFLNSFVGTMAWMAPEVIREERHTKKVDIWSFGVVLWEMITRQIPYFGVETVTIIYGVGQRCLSLPIYDTFPEGIKLILNQCWKHGPEDRPLFDEILLNFDNYFDELQTFSQEKFNSLQIEWKSHIENCFQNMTQARISTSKVEAELIRRRTKELNEARDIKHLYNEKLMRADKLIELLTKCLNAVEKERLKNEGEWKLIQNWKQSLQNPYIDNKVPFLSLGNSPPVQSNIPLKIHKSSTTKGCKKFGSEKIQNRHSMLESLYPEKYNLKVRRKHSVPISKEKNAFVYPSILKRTSQCISNRVLKARTKRKSISCETLYNIPKDNNHQLKQTNKRYSNPVREIHFSTLPPSGKATSLAEGGNCGTINPSFETSHDSLSCLNYNNVIKNYNKNIQQIAYFGPSASISDLNLSSDTATESSNSMLNPSSLIRRNILEDSITECPHMEEDLYDGNQKATEKMSTNLTNNVDSPVVIRERSGRRNNSSNNSILRKDSLTDSQNPITDSINEKERIAQGLIRPCNFLIDVIKDYSEISNPPTREKLVTKPSFESKNLLMWSPEHRSQLHHQ